MNYQIDKYLNIIGYKIQLPDNKYDEINASYKAICAYIGNNNELAQDVDCSIYYQGSFAIGTVIKPLRGDDFDLDIVVEFDSSKREMTAGSFYRMFYKTFENGKYKEMLNEFRNNVRLDYKSSNYHFDIMPSVPLSSNSNALSVPDTKKRDWVVRSPKTYIEWFKNQTNKIPGYQMKVSDNRRFIMESVDEVKPLKEPAPYEITPTLIRAVQLLKRMKDVFFRDYKGEREPQSIVITTLAANFYNGEYSVYDALKNIILKMKQKYDNNNRFEVRNPSYPSEVFTEKWSRYTEYYDNLKNFVYFLNNNIKRLEVQSGAAECFKTLFGDKTFNELREETKLDSFWKDSSTNIERDNVFPKEQVVIKKKERGNA